MKIIILIFFLLIILFSTLFIIVINDSNDKDHTKYMDLIYFMILIYKKGYY